jgi:hypothetical protein
MLTLHSSAPNETTPDRVRFGLHRGGQVQVWRAPHRFKVIAAGRRWGKTQFGRTWLYDKAFKRGAGRYWYVAPTREDAKDIMWSDLKLACHPDWLAEPPREGDLALNLTNGAEIRLWSGEKGDSLRGRPLKALVMDEYADMEARLFFEVLRPSLADFRAPALWIGTPKSFNHFYELFERGQDDSRQAWASWQFRSLDNPFLDPDEVEEARRDTDPRTFRQEWEASFEAISGRAYYTFHRGSDVGDVVLDHAHPVCVSFDFNVQPAVATIGQKVGRRGQLWREVWIEHAGGESTKATAARACELLKAEHWRGPVRIYGDATGKSAKTTGPSDHQVVLDTMRSAGWHTVWCIPKANPHVRDRVSAVNSRFETMEGRRREFTVDRSCKRTIADLEQVIFADNGELDKKSNPLLTHISDALGYWVHQDWPPVVKVAAASAHYGHLI